MPLHEVVKNILAANITPEERKRQIDEIKEAIEIAEKVCSGEFTCCKICGDYFLSRSFFTDTEIKTEKAWEYDDKSITIANYIDKPINYTYKICPKGCKELISRKEI